MQKREFTPDEIKGIWEMWGYGEPIFIIASAFKTSTRKIKEVIDSRNEPPDELLSGEFERVEE